MPVGKKKKQRAKIAPRGKNYPPIWHSTEAVFQSLDGL